MGVTHFTTHTANLAEKIASTVTESSYRVTADIISNTCGQSISHGGAWKLVQQLGEPISKKEEALVSCMDAERTTRKRRDCHTV